MRSAIQYTNDVFLAKWFSSYEAARNWKLSKHVRGRICFYKPGIYYIVKGFSDFDEPSQDTEQKWLIGYSSK